MSAQDLITILQLLPPDTPILMETENGNLMSPCFSDSGVEESIDDMGKPEVIYVLCPCYCGLEELEDVHEESFELQILNNVN